MTEAMFPDFTEDRPENERAVSRMNPDGTITTLFVPDGGSKIFRTEDGALKLPFEDAVWSVNPATGMIRLDFLGKYLELLPFFYTPAMPEPATLWSDLNAAQRAAINPVLDFGEQDNRRNLKFSLDFSFYPTQNMAGVGFVLWATDAPYDTFVYRDPQGNIVDAGIQFPLGLRLSFADIVESGYKIQTFTARRRPAILITGFTGVDGTRISLDPTSIINGDVADRDLKEIPAGVINFASANPSATYLYPYQVKTPYEQWRSFLVFNTGAVLPAGATITAVDFFFVKMSILEDNPASFQLPPYRLNIYIAKDKNSWGGTIDATLADWNSMISKFDHEYQNSSTARQNITTPIVNVSRIATAGDIVLGNPDSQGRTNVMLQEATWTYPAWQWIYWTIMSANNTPTNQPKLTVTWTPPPSGPPGGFINRWNRPALVRRQGW